jgi:hypothetical protein
MTVISAVTPTSVNPADSYPQAGEGILPQNADLPEPNGDGSAATPYSPSWGRRALVVVMGMMIAGIALAAIGMGLMQGSWWHSYGTDEPLDRATRARVEAMRDEIDVGGVAPDAAAWLNAALDSGVDPSTTRLYLYAAQEALRATGDPELVEMAEELRLIIQTIYHPPAKHTATPYPEAMLEWPW